MVGYIAKNLQLWYTIRGQDLIKRVAVYHWGVMCVLLMVSPPGTGGKGLPAKLIAYWLSYEEDDVSKRKVVAMSERKVYSIQNLAPEHRT